MEENRSKVSASRSQRPSSKTPFIYRVYSISPSNVAEAVSIQVVDSEHIFSIHQVHKLRNEAVFSIGRAGGGFGNSLLRRNTGNRPPSVFRVTIMAYVNSYPGFLLPKNVSLAIAWWKLGQPTHLLFDPFRTCTNSRIYGWKVTIASGCSIGNDADLPLTCQKWPPRISYWKG
jgi:hypothetical protein